MQLKNSYYFQNLSFIVLNLNLSILIYLDSKVDIIIVNVYINNILLILKNSKLINQIKERVNKKYNVKDMRELNIIIRWKIKYKLEIKILKID